MLYSTKNVMPGFAVSTTAAVAADLAGRPDVVSVRAIVPATVASTTTDDFTHALAVWQGTGLIGTNVKVGIIDTGIDYTHNDFGGDSDSYATATAQASSQTYNWRSKLTTKGQAKIAGGHDFAGLSYDGGTNSTPQPDPNPLDCYGHGTHVAGILAGYGEDAGGSTFTGSYQTLTGAALNSMDIAPGSAPGAQIYSLKVFGCTGSSDLVMEALDWALDPNNDGDDSDHLDIVNLSLGSDYSAEDDPENAMIDKLASYGVLSVVAAGNAGDITLVGGSPGSAVSALTVADSVGDTPEDAADTLNGSSSRGTYGSIGTIKPDVAAPGTDILSAGFGTGNAGVSMTGTSMATPHVAGIAALVKEAHPSWTAGEIKADVMNTAVHDVTTQADGQGSAYGPNRVGSGRVDAALATTNTLLAYVADSSGQGSGQTVVTRGVSASFGVVEVPAGTTVIRTRTVSLKNLGSASVTPSLSYQPSTTQTGVSYTVSPASVIVSAGATATVTITLIATGTIGRTMDPTMDPTQNGLSRDFTPLASGRLLVATDSSTIRLPVSAAVKPVSTTTASVNSPVTALTVTGAGFDDSASTDAGGYHGYASLLSVFALGGSSTKKPTCTTTILTGCTQGARDASGDLRYVGATSDYPIKGAAGSAYFSVTSWADWTAPGSSTAPYVDIWTVSDPATEAPDFEAFVATEYPDGDDDQSNDEDYVGVWLYDFGTGSNDWIADLNGLDPIYESNVFDSDTLIIPVPLASLVPAGGTAATSLAHLRYEVGTYSPFGYGADAVLDQIPAGISTIAFDPAKPGITALNPANFPAGSNQNLFWPDAGGVSAPITLAPANANGSILVLHQDGASGNRAQVVTFATHNTVAPSITGTAKVGYRLTAVNGTWSPIPSSYTYQWLRNGAAISGATSSTYTLTGAESGTAVSVRVTAKPNGYPPATVTSGSTVSIAPGTFLPETAPAIAGTAKVGYTLTAVNGTWWPSATGYGYRWLRNASGIGGATAATYKPTAADVGAKLTVEVTVVRAGYTKAVRTSGPSATVLAGTFTNTVAPKVSGTAKVGYALTAVNGTWSPTPTGYGYRWLRNGSGIGGATASTYKPTAADVGTKLTVEVTVVRAGYTKTVRTSGPSPTVLAGTFANTLAPKVSGTAKVGYTLAASSGTWSPAPSSYTYQWRRNGSGIGGATGATYKPTIADVGKTITVNVTVSRSGYATSSRLSAATGTVTR